MGPLLTLKLPATAVIFCAIIACGGTSGKGLTLDRDRIELGKLKTEDSVEASLKITNNGSKTVQIGGVEFGCGCTKATFPPKLEAGESGQIKIVFKPELFWSGERVEKGTIETSDAEQPKLQFSVKVDLDPPVRLEPPATQIISFAPIKSKTVELGIEPRSDKAAGFKLSIPQGPSGITSVSRSGNTRKLKFDASFFSPGDHVLHTTFDSSVGPIDYDFVFQAAEGPVSNPDRIAIPRLSKGDVGVKLRELHLFTRKGSLKVTEMKADSASLRTEFEKTGKAFRAAVYYKGGWTVGSHSGFVTLGFDDSKYPELKIPYHVVVTK
jgi:hypothetical protein